MAEMTLKQAWAYGEDKLQVAGIGEATLDAWYLLEWATGVSKAKYFMDPSRNLQDEEEKQYLEGIEKRAMRIPLQHITGEQEFMGLKFLVNEHVLVPRQDTEILVEEGLKRIRPNMKVLDMCTGSGCIIISLEQLSQKDYSGYNCTFAGVDVSSDALAKAAENVALHHANVKLISSDLFENIEGEFDIIISNPPYIRTSVIEGLEEEVKCHDPFIALDGKEDGLYFYRRIVDEGRKYLKSGGWLLFEIGHDQREEVMQLMEEAGFVEISAKKDLAGLDRVVMARYNKG